MIKEVPHAYIGAIWYHSEPSDVLYSSYQFLALDFFAVSYSKIALLSLDSEFKGQIRVT